MSDLYTEVIVKRKASAADAVKKAALIAGTVLAAVACLLTAMNVLALVLLLAFAAADYFLLPRLDLEFEYLYVNGELDVDKIMSKQKRKRVYSADIANLEILAPTKSHMLDSYNNRNDIKKYDYSSNMPDHKIYTMVVKGDKGMEMVIFEPNEVILRDMKRVAPREVNLQ